MKYNIGFTLGDPGGDGHACTTDYHIVANHSADDVQGMEFDLTPLELRDLIGKPNWVPTKFLGWRTWKTSVYFKIII